MFMLVVNVLANEMQSRTWRTHRKRAVTASVATALFSRDLLQVFLGFVLLGTNRDSRLDLILVSIVT